MNAQTQASKNALHKSLERRHNASTSLAALWRPALLQAFVKLDPRQLLRSPVMLVVELTAVLTTLLCFVPDQAVPTSVALQIALWLWFTVLFANFAEALAEGVARPARTVSRPAARASPPISGAPTAVSRASLPAACARATWYGSRPAR